MDVVNFEIQLRETSTFQYSVATYLTNFFLRVSKAFSSLTVSYVNIGK